MCKINLNLKQNEANFPLTTLNNVQGQSLMTEMRMQLSQMRAIQRKERSRVAAQIRRNREAQSLMLIQNALPISTQVLGLSNSTGTDSVANSNTNKSNDHSFNYQNHHSNRSAAFNLEKTGALSIAGHTLFLLNRLSSCTLTFFFNLKNMNFFNIF